MLYYHAWFQTKYRRFMLNDEIDQRIHELFEQISKEKQITLLASGSLPEHMHILVGLEDDQELSWAMKSLKGISSRKIFLEFSWLKEHFRINNFWARRYAAKEVPVGALRTVAAYVRNQKKDLHI